MFKNAPGRVNKCSRAEIVVLWYHQVCHFVCLFEGKCHAAGKLIYLLAEPGFVASVTFVTSVTSVTL